MSQESSCSCTTSCCLCNLTIDRFFSLSSETGCKDKGFSAYPPNFSGVFFRGLLLFPRQAAAKARAFSMSSDVSPEVHFRDPLPASGIIPAPSVSFRFRKTLFPATPAFILSISRRFRSRKRVQKYSLFPDPQTNTGIFLRKFYGLFANQLYYNRLWRKDFQEKERGREGGTPYKLSRTREKGTE